MTPRVYVDGKTDSVNGGIYYPGNMYPFYRLKATARMAVSTPIRITMTCTYDTVANTGNVSATVYNDSSASVTSILHFAIIENKIPYPWLGMTSVEHVCRNMLPDGNGESITIAAGGNQSRSRVFTIDTSWNEKNCKIVAFLQNNSNKRIWQASEIVVVPAPKMRYWGLTFTELSGYINRIVQPGEGVRFYIKAKNIGGGVYNSTTSVSTTDPYVSITSQTSQSVAMSTGDMDTVLRFDCNISSSCPSPRTVVFKLQFGSPSDTASYSFIVTNTPGFSDNMDVDTLKWVHGPVYTGGYDQWHRSNYRNHSASYSWYFGVEASHLYSDYRDAALTSVYFVATPDSNLKFWHWYYTETSWDYCFAEIDNNSGNWQTLGTYNGNQSSWNQVSLPMANYAGQTVRIRFRLISDQNTNYEGWYVDDVSVPIIVAIQENKDNGSAQALAVTPNPFRAVLNVKWCKNTRPVGLVIYDASGRVVRNLTPLVATAGTSLTWNGTDGSGQKLASGIYFIRMTTATNEQIRKVMFLR